VHANVAVLVHDEVFYPRALCAYILTRYRGGGAQVSPDLSHSFFLSFS